MSSFTNYRFYGIGKLHIRFRNSKLTLAAKYINIDIHIAKKLSLFYTLTNHKVLGSYFMLA